MTIFVLHDSDEGLVMHQFTSTDDAARWIGERTGHQQWPSAIRDFTVIRGEKLKIEPVDVVKIVRIE